MANESTAARRHLWQLDVVRLLTFSAVIAVHAIAFTELPDNVAAGAAMMLLQFGREVFFALSGFVLVYAARTRSVEPWQFWKRRVPLVAVPYLVWTLIYWWSTPGGRPGLGVLGADLLDGNAEYHLYFLLVTLQLYLVFPWLMRFIRRTAHRAVLVLTVVGTLNLAWLAALQYAPPNRASGGCAPTNCCPPTPSMSSLAATRRCTSSGSTPSWSGAGDRCWC